MRLDLLCRRAPQQAARPGDEHDEQQAERHRILVGDELRRDERLDQPEKNWKFSLADVKERAHWQDYINAFEDMFSNTSTKNAPWHIIPADNKWFTHAAIADIIVKKLKELNLKYPEVSEEHKKEILKVKEILEAE